MLRQYHLYCLFQNDCEDQQLNFPLVCMDCSHVDTSWNSLDTVKPQTSQQLQQEHVFTNATTGHHS